MIKGKTKRTKGSSQANITGPQAEVLLSYQPRSGFISGQGAGKTHTMSFLSLLFVNLFPHVIGLIAANTYSQLSKATLLEIKKGWEKLGVKEYHKDANPSGQYVTNQYPPSDWPSNFPKFDNPKGIIFWRNGAVTFTASLDNYLALEGLTLGWALLDETKDTRQEALTQVITARLRAKGVFVRYDAEERIKTGLDKGASIYDIFPFTTEEETKGHKNRAINPLYIFTSPTKEMWLIDFFKLEDYRDEIKELIYQKDRYFVKVFDGKKVIISSTYLNFENLPDNYIGDRIAGMPAELVNFNIYGDPFSKSGGEYAYGFNYSDHVDPSVKYSAGYPLHFTVDFNTSPYMSGLVAQLVPMRSEIAGYKWNNRESWLDLNFIYEYSLSHPRNSAGHLGEAFAEDFSHLSGHGIFVYGDATGKNKVPIKGVESAFSDLLLPLDRFLFRDSLRIPASNPSYKHISKDMLGRRDFTNMLFEGKHPVRVRISPKCANYIRDLEFCTEDVNGRLAKPKNKDGIEEMGHHLQAGEYFYCHPKSLGYLAEY